MLAAGCGSTNYAWDFLGTYFGNYTATVTYDSTGQTVSGMYQTSFQITEGPGPSDLVFAGPCGMTGYARSATRFNTFQSNCTIYDSSSNCDITYELQAGSGTKVGADLTMNIPGGVTFQCPAGNDSGTLMLAWDMTQQ
jgi:hypothetical protein